MHRSKIGDFIVYCNADGTKDTLEAIAPPAVGCAGCVGQSSSGCWGGAVCMSLPQGCSGQFGNEAHIWVEAVQ